MSIKINKQVLGVILSLTLGFSAQAMDESDLEARKMGLSLEQYKQYIEVGMSLREYKEMAGITTPDHIDKEHPSSPSQPKLRSKTEIHRKGDMSDVLSRAYIHREMHEDKWSDKKMEEGAEIFKSLSFNQLKDPKVLAWVIEQKSLALFQQYMNALSETKIELAKHELNSFKISFEKKNGEKYPFVLDYEIGKDYFFTIGQEGLYTDHILIRKNSSGADNNCLLFSIIRNDVKLLTKVLGNAEEAIKILSVPEMEGRDFSKVRKKFFQDIVTHLDDKYSTVDGRKMTIRELLEPVIANTNELYSTSKAKWTLGTAEELLLNLEHHKLMLDHDFSVIFSLLYDVPTQVLIPSTSDKSQLIPQTPNLFVMPEGQTLFIFHRGMHGCHYQKLIFGSRR